ncbi:hypothetical protein B0T26DRAFT_198011 [Lasiosphaeria miniovina]|uniref:Uncharacterized protein n=1 Tax=Lasiosphaeria miniovina TaxID=1954250 RepID=A0AA40AU06_9PEZI|nr:uncharacterized protein B0T26DRAFT_198011 [Lasiosphaeria miniovina]KAK0721996.1 hypothetical protein B0T26DRAFT_198011 [Lasiosphaeria miniovina]
MDPRREGSRATIRLRQAGGRRELVMVCVLCRQPAGLSKRHVSSLPESNLSVRRSCQDRASVNLAVWGTGRGGERRQSEKEDSARIEQEPSAIFVPGCKISERRKERERERPGAIPHRKVNRSISMESTIHLHGRRGPSPSRKHRPATSGSYSPAGPAQHGSSSARVAIRLSSMPSCRCAISVRWIVPVPPCSLASSGARVHSRLKPPPQPQIPRLPSRDTRDPDWLDWLLSSFPCHGWSGNRLRLASRLGKSGAQLRPPPTISTVCVFCVLPAANEHEVRQLDAIMCVRLCT